MTIPSNARLAKGGSVNPEAPKYAVICGQIIMGRASCGGVLGHLQCTNDGEQSGHWYMVFGPGWLEVNGMWQMNRHGRRRYEHNVRMATDPAADSESRSQAADKLKTGAFAKNRRAEYTVHVGPAARSSLDGAVAIRSHAGGASWLPTRAKCPRCTAVNSIGETLAHLAAQRWQSRHD